MEISGQAGLTDSEWELVKQLAQFALDIKDRKIKGVTIVLDAREMDDCRSLIRKAKEFT